MLSEESVVDSETAQLRAQLAHAINVQSALRDGDARRAQLAMRRAAIVDAATSAQSHAMTTTSTTTTTTTTNVMLASMLSQVERDEAMLEAALNAWRAQREQLLLAAPDVDGRLAVDASASACALLSGLFAPTLREANALGVAAADEARIATSSAIVDACRLRIDASLNDAVAAAVAANETGATLATLWGDGAPVSMSALGALVCWQRAFVRARLAPACVRVCERLGGWLATLHAALRGDANTLAAVRRWVIDVCMFVCACDERRRV